MSLCLHVYLASKWWSSVYVEELAVKRLSCVYACVAAVTVIFLQCGKKKNHYTTQSVFWLSAEQSICTGGYSGVWPSESVCIHGDGCVTTVFGSIKPYLWHGSVFGWKCVLCVWVCLRLSLKLCWAISAMSTKEMTVWFLVSKDAYLYLAVRVHSRVRALGPTWCWKIKADGEGKSSVWPKSRRLVSPERDTVSLFLFLTHTHTHKQTNEHTHSRKQAIWTVAKL